MPHLWARAKGISDAIAVKTVAYIVDMAVRYSVDTVVLCDSKNKPPAMQGEGRSLDISNLLC